MAEGDFNSRDWKYKIEAGTARRAEYGPIWLDLTHKTLRMVGSESTEPIDSYEYQVLWLLIRAQGNRVSEGEMVSFLYDDRKEDIPLSDTIRVYIWRLRKKLLNLTKGKVSIENESSFGYFLKIS